MNKHLRAMTKQHPIRAELQPIWEFIFIGQALLGLFGTASSLGLQYLSAFESIAGLFLGSKGGFSET